MNSDFLFFSTLEFFSFLTTSHNPTHLKSITVENVEELYYGKVVSVYKNFVKMSV